MDDLLTRLRRYGKVGTSDLRQYSELLAEAAAVALTAAQVENERLRTHLQSIADNTCCEGCQEAARVAKAALT